VCSSTAQIKEHFGGYTLVECTDLDEALKWAATLPAASDRAVEVRPAIAVEASRWPQLHLARAELLRQLGRRADAAGAYQAALQLEPPVPERAFIGRRLRELRDTL
jgi:predicted RNA polymerase sigma factor